MYNQLDKQSNFTGTTKLVVNIRFCWEKTISRPEIITRVASNSGDTVFRFQRSEILTLVSFPERTHSVFLWEATGQWI